MIRAALSFPGEEAATFFNNGTISVRSAARRIRLPVPTADGAAAAGADGSFSASFESEEGAPAGVAAGVEAVFNEART